MPVDVVPPEAARLGLRAEIAERSENFPVALRVLPATPRRHLRAIYGFARLADDLGDEAGGDRLALLDWLDAELARAVTGTATHPVVMRLTPTLHECRLSDEPFRRLVEANRRDQRVDRYQDWAALREYCTYSAEPVGRIVLAVFDASTPARVAASDDVCTALQLVEHLQDVGEDRARGRVYLPMDDLAHAGCAAADLDEATASPPLRRVIAFEVHRAHELLRAGPGLVASLEGWARVAVAGYVAGGLATLDAIVSAQYDVLARSARPVRRRVLAHMVRLLAAKRSVAL